MMIVPEANHHRRFRERSRLSAQTRRRSRRRKISAPRMDGKEAADAPSLPLRQHPAQPRSTPNKQGEHQCRQDHY